MCDLALELPTLCPQPLPLLLQGRAGRVELSATAVRAAASARLLLLNADAQPRPRRRRRGGRAARPICPTSRLPSSWTARSAALRGLAYAVDSAAQAALPARYFEALAQREYPSRSAQPVAFERLVLDTSECDIDTFWSALDAPLCEVRASASGLIEESGEGMLQLDFANRVIGGGVLRSAPYRRKSAFCARRS